MSSISILNDPPDMYELDIAMRSIKGVSYDGLSPKMLDIIPNSLKEILLSFIQKIFFTKYPNYFFFFMDFFF